MGRKEGGRKGGRKLVINICKLVRITYAKKKASVLELERLEFVIILQAPKALVSSSKKWSSNRTVLCEVLVMESGTWYRFYKSLIATKWQALRQRSKIQSLGWRLRQLRYTEKGMEQEE